MSGFSAIELSKLAPPDVVEPLDFESILNDMKADLSNRDPQLAQTLNLESEPLTKLLEVCAYRELIIRQRVNDASRAVMLAYASGNDLDHLASLFAVQRQQISPADPTAIPPVGAVYEDDERFRRRVQLSLEGHSTAGPVGSYIFWGLSASPDVKDININSPTPGTVEVTILSTQNDGRASQSLLNTVNTVLNRDDVRPLTDQVIVQPATIVNYTIDATLFFQDGPGSEVVQANAEQALREFIEENHRLGNDISISGIYAALHQQGVYRVDLRSPSTNISVPEDAAAYCHPILGINIAGGSRNDGGQNG